MGHLGKSGTLLILRGKSLESGVTKGQLESSRDSHTVFGVSRNTAARDIVKAGGGPREHTR